MAKLADVISLAAYRQFKQIVKISTRECKRPWHRKDYVVINPADHKRLCVACGVQVSLVQHPSMKKAKFYG